MHNRHAGALGVLLSCGLGAAALAMEERPAATARLDVLLTVAPGVPDDTRSALIQEANLIWQSHGIALTWRPGTGSCSESVNCLRVLVVSRDGAASPREEGRLTVGELLRPANGPAVAVISIESAERLIQEAHSPASLRVTALDHHRAGLVLGRAVAHEIGHYLLGTRTHVAHGLMRARFDAREFVDLRSGTFGLDPDSAALLQARIRRGSLQAP